MDIYKNGIITFRGSAFFMQQPEFEYRITLIFSVDFKHCFLFQLRKK